MADRENKHPRLVGTYEHGLDDKGRMVLPAKIRARLGETGMVGVLDNCLGLWTVEGFDHVSDRMLDRVEAGEASMKAYRKFMAFAAEVTPDQQGRVVIPGRLRSMAHLGSEVVVTGRGDRAEIWDRARWVEEFDAGDVGADDDADIAATIAELRI